jgi:hypothetical protein
VGGVRHRRRGGHRCRRPVRHRPPTDRGRTCPHHAGRHAPDRRRRGPILGDWCETPVDTSTPSESSAAQQGASAPVRRAPPNHEAR